MNNNKILITAATGNIGIYLSRALHSKDIPFLAATRNADKAREKIGFPVDTVHLDFKDPAGFTDALKTVDILFLCGPAGTPGAEDLLLPLIREAVEQGVKHVVFIASYPKIKDVILKEGLNHTFIRANFFMQNFDMYQTEDIRDLDQIFMPCGNGKAPFIHTHDIGEVAAEMISDPEKFKNETIYLTGPEALDHEEAAVVFSEVLGRKITYRNPDDDTYREVMTERGYSDAYIDAMIAVFGKIKSGQVANTSDMVEKILQRKPYTLKQYVEENKEHFTGEK